MTQHALAPLRNTSIRTKLTDPLNLEHVACEKHAPDQKPSATLQLTDRQRGVQFLLDLTVTHAFPDKTNDFDETSGIIEYDELLAVAATVYTSIELHFTPKQSLLLFAGFAALLLQTPGIHDTWLRSSSAHLHGLGPQAPTSLSGRLRLFRVQQHLANSTFATSHNSRQHVKSQRD